MIYRTKEEVASAMAENPEQWAQLFLDGQEMLDKFVKTNQEKDYNIAKLERMLLVERGQRVPGLSLQ